LADQRVPDGSKMLPATTPSPAPKAAPIAMSLNTTPMVVPTPAPSAMPMPTFVPRLPARSS
jgi:hypothetical protein